MQDFQIINKRLKKRKLFLLLNKTDDDQIEDRAVYFDKNIFYLNFIYIKINNFLFK